MTNPHELSTACKETIRWLAGHKCGSDFTREKVLHESKLPEADYTVLLLFLAQRDAVEIAEIDDGGDYASHFCVQARIAQILSELDNPPLRDYWQELKCWFLSKPWSLPFMVIFGVLTFLTALVPMFKTLFGLLSRPR